MTSPIPTPERYEPHLPPVPQPRPQRTTSTWSWGSAVVHLERVGDPQAAVRMLLVHGAGGNAAAMWPYAAHLAGLGAHVTVADLPGYGATTVAEPGTVRYEHWRALLIDLVEAEHDERPLILVGASMGGMLAYDVAAATGKAAGLVVTCLLDVRDSAVRARLSWHPVLGRVAGPDLRLLAGPAADLRVPIRWIADMRHIANTPALVSAVLTDRTGGGGRVPLGWMRSYLDSAPVTEPEDFTGTPVLMVHPGNDRWTPLKISRAFFDRIAAPKRLVVLHGCGHFPAEQPGFAQMLTAVTGMVAELTA
ncbi:alpha/beta hydrolase [Kocuria dechangensis]|uniref:alpha/beta hydrolase n=1 Tax=Kocuria dechangensis TaxID=1176249 RepID=UPI001E565354|nr:alpha/beta hydrolase [Kocuria dechangensis]